MTSYTAQDVSVVICAYTEKRWDELVAAVTSVQRQTAPPREVIVVIDHNPRLLDRADRLLPQVTSLGNRQAPGAGGSRNTGAALARSDLIAFLDDDAEAQPDWLENLVTGYGNPLVLGVGGALKPRWLGGRPRWFPEEFNWVVGCTYRGMPHQTAPVRNLIAANMSVRQEVFEAIGGFRTSFGNTRSTMSIGSSFLRSCAGDEETELCIRASKRWTGGIWLYEPRAKVTHRVSPDRTQLRYFLSRCYDEGLGKAQLVHLVGSRSGLSSELTYTLRVLSSAVVRNAVGDGRPWGIESMQRSSAILAGLAATALGYAMGTGIRLAAQTPVNSHAD